jgi:nucleotide-binding universal stress UspA family protein
MTLGKILVPCDFSDFSRAAVPVAADLCRKFGATLALEHVVDTWLDYPEFAPQIEMNNSPHLSEAAQESLDQLAAEQEGVETTATVCTGIPPRMLADSIKKGNIDLVVMATHGRSGLAHVLLGSVTERLVRMSTCPLLTIHPNH